MLLGMDELRDVDVGADLVVGLQTGDLGVDELGAPFARQGDAMVAVLDEVGAADLEDLDRRHRPHRGTPTAGSTAGYETGRAAA